MPELPQQALFDVEHWQLYSKPLPNGQGPDPFYNLIHLELANIQGQQHRLTSKFTASLSH